MIQGLPQEEREEFRQEYNKFELLKKFFDESSKEVPREMKRFKEICILLNKVKQGDTEEHFIEDLRNFELFARVAKRSEFAFPSLVSAKLEEVRLALRASPFYQSSEPVKV